MSGHSLVKQLALGSKINIAMRQKCNDRYCDVFIRSGPIFLAIPLDYFCLFDNSAAQRLFSLISGLITYPLLFRSRNSVLKKEHRERNASSDKYPYCLIDPIQECFSFW